MDINLFRKLSPYYQTHFLADCLFAEYPIEEEWITHFRQQSIDLEAFDFGEPYYQGLQLLYRGDFHKDSLIESPYQLILVRDYGSQPLVQYVDQFKPNPDHFQDFSLLHEQPDFERAVFLKWIAQPRTLYAHFMPFLFHSPHILEYVKELTPMYAARLTQYITAIPPNHPVIAYIPQDALFQQAIANSDHISLTYLSPGLSVLAQLCIQQQERFNPSEQLIYTPDIIKIADDGGPMPLTSEELSDLLFSREPELFGRLALDGIHIAEIMNYPALSTLLKQHYQQPPYNSQDLDEIPLSF